MVIVCSFKSNLKAFLSCVGGCLTAKWRCNSGHFGTWSNSEKVGSGRLQMAVINLQIILYTLLTGISWDKLEVS